MLSAMSSSSTGAAAPLAQALAEDQRGEARRSMYCTLGAAFDGM
jgi:hypothetical protein